MGEGQALAWWDWRKDDDTQMVGCCLGGSNAKVKLKKSASEDAVEHMPLLSIEVVVATAFSLTKQQ